MKMNTNVLKTVFTAKEQQIKNHVKMAYASTWTLKMFTNCKISFNIHENLNFNL